MKPFMPKSLMLRPGSGSFFRYRILEGSVKTNEAAIPEGNEVNGSVGLDKSFGFSNHFGNKFELGDEIGRGYKCRAKFKKGELKVIPKAKTINFFKLGPKLSLVDLPGYGFAYAKEEVIKLGKTL